LLSYFPINGLYCLQQAMHHELKFILPQNRKTDEKIYNQFFCPQP